MISILVYARRPLKAWAMQSLPKSIPWRLPQQPLKAICKAESWDYKHVYKYRLRSEDKAFELFIKLVVTSRSKPYLGQEHANDT